MENTEFSSTYKSMHCAIQRPTTDRLENYVTVQIEDWQITETGQRKSHRGHCFLLDKMVPTEVD